MSRVRVSSSAPRSSPSRSERDTLPHRRCREFESRHPLHRTVQLPAAVTSEARASASSTRHRWSSSERSERSSRPPAPCVTVAVPVTIGDSGTVHFPGRRLCSMSRRTRFLLAAGLLAAAVGLAPLLPDAGAPSGGSGIRYDGALMPLAEPAPRGPAPAPALATAPGRGEVTARMRREIERVVAAGRALGPDSGRVTTATLVDTQVRCAVFSGQRYCLGIGWTDQTPRQRSAPGSPSRRRPSGGVPPRPPPATSTSSPPCAPGGAVRAPAGRGGDGGAHRRGGVGRQGLAAATRGAGSAVAGTASSRTTPRRSRATPTSRRRPSRGRRAGSTPARPRS